MQVSATKAAIAGIGIKGGSESAAYDYTGLSISPGVTTGWAASDGNLHATASKYTVSGGVENPSQWYSISQTTVCYRVLAPISGAVFTDANGSGQPGAGQTGFGGLNVTIVDNTTHGQTTVTDGGQRDLFLATARGRLVHGVLRLTRLRLPAVGSDLGRSLPRQPDRLRLPGSFDRLDRELLRVPAARLGRRHGLQGREPGSDQQRQLAAVGLDRHALRRSAAGVDDVERERLVQDQRGLLDVDDLHALRDAAERHLGPGRAPALDHDRLRPEPERERCFRRAE